VRVNVRAAYCRTAVQAAVSEHAFLHSMTGPSQLRGIFFEERRGG
jgi:hypothetical protein